MEDLMNMQLNDKFSWMDWVLFQLGMMLHKRFGHKIYHLDTLPNIRCHLNMEYQLDMLLHIKSLV
jgi:hypothetical protein